MAAPAWDYKAHYWQQWRSSKIKRTRQCLRRSTNEFVGWVWKVGDRAEIARVWRIWLKQPTDWLPLIPSGSRVWISYDLVSPLQVCLDWNTWRENLVTSLSLISHMCFPKYPSGPNTIFVLLASVSFARVEKVLQMSWLTDEGHNIPCDEKSLALTRSGRYKIPKDMAFLRIPPSKSLQSSILS